ncbi:nucleoside triphosphate pyrophosphohydrolase [Allohahella marinimesophila]|uniref:NTP pyrophosphohydrolase MazG-like domain-containing protein n=1 Tax=Allohahella marinimesophila TaxID=1054972 RepID=A0ABP7NPJ9_9GAMM
MTIARRLHLSLDCSDLQQTVIDYSSRLGCRPTLVINGEFALWRTAELNLCVRQADEPGLRHLGWELPEQAQVSNEVDCNGIEWACFTLQQQAEEIRQCWPGVDYQPEQGYSLQDLRYLMSRLRDAADGCPWDLKQDFNTILPHTLEETYELAEAIEREDWPHVAEELGDYLFQAVFYCRLGEEQGHFAWEDVVGSITRKLLRRHPHVFPNGRLDSRRPAGAKVDPAEVSANWKRIKAEEKTLGLSGESLEKTSTVSAGSKRLLAEINAGLPALQKATRLQNKAAEVGFDWTELAPVFEKLREEIDELGEEIGLGEDGELQAPGDHERIVDELGDVLFCCVNLARFLKVEPEAALRHANEKFTSRFNYIEAALLQQGVTRERWMDREVSLDTMEALWVEAKRSQ